jgi:hypothetical protein
MKLSTLKKQAQWSTAYRGHRMQWLQGSNQTMVGVCRHCGMQVQLLTRPSPNEIAVGGEAVALSCKTNNRNSRALPS